MTYIIAEAGSCHDGQYERALRLVALAAEIGANAVKFQWLSSAERLAERRRAPDYLPAYQVLEFPLTWHADLAHAAQAHGLDYLCTVYLPEDIATVAPYVARFKVASFEAPDEAFVLAHHAYGKPILVSHGMGGEPYAAGCLNLHCVSAYPTPIDQINLARLRDRRFHGLSDHTKHKLTGALAVAAGAEIIEFHVRLEDSDPAGADFAVARTPGEASGYVNLIRLAETMLGDGERKVQPAEEPMTRYRVQP